MMTIFGFYASFGLAMTFAGETVMVVAEARNAPTTAHIPALF
jgi:hypothetical protein